MARIHQECPSCRCSPQDQSCTVCSAHIPAGGTYYDVRLHVNLKEDPGYEPVGPCHTYGEAQELAARLRAYPHAPPENSYVVHGHWLGGPPDA